MNVCQCEQMSVSPVTDICTLTDTILAMSALPCWWQRNQHNKLVSVIVSGARVRVLPSCVAACVFIAEAVKYTHKFCFYALCASLRLSDARASIRCSASLTVARAQLNFSKPAFLSFFRSGLCSLFEQ